jgi:hypothetical protein
MHRDDPAGSALFSTVAVTDGVALMVLVMLVLTEVVELMEPLADKDGLMDGEGLGEATNISQTYAPVAVTGRSLSPCSGMMCRLACGAPNRVVGHDRLLCRVFAL